MEAMSHPVAAVDAIASGVGVDELIEKLNKIRVGKKNKPFTFAAKNKKAFISAEAASNLKKHLAEKLDLPRGEASLFFGVIGQAIVDLGYASHCADGLDFLLNRQGMNDYCAAIGLDADYARKKVMHAIVESVEAIDFNIEVSLRGIV